MGAAFGWRAATSFLLLGAVLPALGGCPDWLEVSFLLALGRLRSCAAVLSSILFVPAMASYVCMAEALCVLAADLKVVCGSKGSPRGLGLVLAGGLLSEDWGLLSPFLFFPAVDLWRVAADFELGCPRGLFSQFVFEFKLRVCCALPLGIVTLGAGVSFHLFGCVGLACGSIFSAGQSPRGMSSQFEFDFKLRAGCFLLFLPSKLGMPSF
ncbi:hypothetical protein OIU78_020310 [Salix suchowensis]|nr:hypothetical protein OIU78_020310 [Salix suchowensis]